MPRWVVVGGADKGGILVREGQDVKSAQAGVRLATGAIVEELQLLGERLQFKLVAGDGPGEGWVSIKAAGKPLLAREQQDSGTAPRKPQAADVVEDPKVLRRRQEEIDQEIFERVQDIDPVHGFKFESPWIPHGADPDIGEVRLFCFFGAGKLAGQFREWNALGRGWCPTVAVHPIELPGKGSFKGDTIGDAHVLAETFVRDVLDHILEDGRPFALLGFSIGARICYEIARRRPPLRLYVAGRAAPHVGAVGAGNDESVPRYPEDHREFLLWVISMKWGNEDLLRQILEHPDEEADPDEYLRKYAKPIRDDLTIGTTPLRDEDREGRQLPVRVACRICVYESENDATWPPSVVRKTWDRYSPGGRCKKRTYPKPTHDELCSPSGEPLLKDVLVDLHELLYAGLPED